jgi:hypothetical protein
MGIGTISRRAAIGALGGVAFGARRVAAVGQSALAAAGALTDVGGLRVGHFTDTRRPTGCTGHPLRQTRDGRSRL